MAKSSTPNSSNSTYNVLSNNENLEGVRKQVIDGIKIDLLDTLKMDDIMVDRNKLANDINDNRRDNFVGHPVIDKLKLNNSHPVVKENDYKDILDEYDSLMAKKEANNWPDNHAEFNKKLRELDTRLAERVILDNGLAIQFKSGERFEDGKNAEEESKIAYENLNKMELNGIKKYEGKIDWISEEKGETNYFIIKRKPEELALIKAALKAIDEVSAMKDEDIETLKSENKKNSDTITDLTQRIEELEKNKKIEDEKKQEEIAELKKKYEALEQGNQTEGTDTDGKNGESTTKKGTSTGTNNSPTNSEKTPAETTEQTSNEATKQPEKGYLTEEQIDKILDDKLKKYLAPLLEAQEKTTRKAPENKELNSKSRERSRESVETNPLYVSRKDVEKSVLASRKDSEFPVGNIEIKGTYVKVEEFQFYEEMKQEYILAKGNIVKLQQLDREFAELAILCSPRGVTMEHRYQIRLTEEEIVAGGLVVSPTRLARYGLAVDFFEYTNTIIEREYLERLESIQQIETEITDLTTSITELHRKINIEGHGDEKTLLEMKEKREKQKELRETLRVLILSLASLGNNGIDKLLGKENDLLKELDKLNKNKSELDLNIQKLNDEIQKMIEDREGVLRDEFAEKLQSEKGITFNGHTYRYEYSQKPSRNHDKKFIINWRVDGKIVRSETTDTNVLPSSDYDGKTDGKWIRKQWETLRQQYIEQNIDFFKSNDDDFKKKNADLKKLKMDKEKLDKEIADKEKELAEIRKQIEEKESKNKKRVVVESFDDGDEGSYFYRFCKENGIKRKDNEEIPEIGGMNPDVTYLDKDGRELKLEPSNEGANDDGYDQPFAKPYELVYYEETESTGTDAIIGQIISIMNEQDVLEKEKEELEIKLQNEKSENIKITIEEQIKKIDQQLLKIKQKVTDITNTTRKYKEKITQYKYRVYKVRPIPLPDWKQETFEMTSVISDMGTDVFREKASLRAEEYLKAYYKSLGRWQVGSRLALFLGRGRKRKKIINTYMKNMSKNPFQTDAGYGALNEQSQNAADRHEHELATGMEAINKITTVHNQQVDDLCKDYLNNLVNDDQFQQKFNQIIAADANVQNALNGQSITHVGTNILLRLQEQKALNQLILDMDAQLAQYVATGNVVHMDNMRNYVSQFIKDYQKTPAFMANFEQFVKGDLNARNQLRQYLNHQRAVMQMQITNLRMNIDILNKGKSAYQIDNKDRETGKGSWKFKLGHFMDKHPRGTAIASTAISVGIGLGTGLIASPVVAGALSLGLFGGLVGTTNAVKKWTHHTKEQNTHEKNVATDYRNEQAKIQAWQNQALNGHGWRKYKAKRQLALYDQTTQENIQMSDQITEYITNLSSKVGPLTADENNFMRCNLIEGWARLKYYRQMGHNFLASEQVDKTEKDMKRLEKSITLGLQKIGKTTNDIETNMTATNQQNTNITYAVIQNDLKASYDKSLIQFKRERRNLSLKYGFGTAIASIGVGAFFQWITGTGMRAKEIPGTPGTPGTPSSTTSHSGGTDNFGLGKDNIPGVASFADSGNVYTTSKSVISGAPNGSTVTFNYTVGTDATHVMTGHRTSADLASKISGVSSNISHMSGLTTPQKNAFLTELSSLSYSGLTNDNGAAMRAAEYLEHCAQAMSDCAATAASSDVARFHSLIPAFHRAPGVSGTSYNKLAERFMTGTIDITTPAIPGTPGTPGIPAKRRGRWFMGMPLFFNTFKDRKAKKDTTDQNFGRGSQQQPKQPQPQPKQPNPNQPHNP